MKEYARYSAAKLLQMIKAGEVSVETLTRYYLDRIEKYDAKLNTVAELNPNAVAQA